MAELGGSGWFGTRCVFDFGTGDDEDERVYEERLTVWRARDLDDAIAKGEAEALVYAEGVDAEFTGLTQVYRMSDDLSEGAEVFSLVRLSGLPPEEYLDRFFDTGGERQQHWRGPETNT